METVTTANPLRAGLQAERTPAPNVLVIFGASGDLTRRKLIPALYNLARERLLPAGFAVVGYARRPYTTEEFRQLMRAAVDRFSRSRPVQEAVWESFADRLYYLSGQYDRPEDLQTLAEFLGLLDRRHGTAGNRLYYLATPPDAYPVVIHQIGQAGLGGDRSNDAWTRIIVEKPFGRDLETARALNRILAGVFDERQIYRIDHYLGKETVQNILVFRFANGIFEPLWNRQYVDHVQITVSESIGIEGRGAYYDQAGALRDMVQNHMLQLLALVAMEPPVAFDADAVRDEKVKVEGDATAFFAEAKRKVAKESRGFPAPPKIVECVEAVQRLCPEPGHLVMLTPQGRRLDQPLVEKLAQHNRLLLLCGRYEGFDERIRILLQPEEISLGDFVLNGGEVAAMAIIDAVIRLTPGVLGDQQSAREDSFSGSERLLEYAQYTRPRVYRGLAVPEVLLSGDHQRIAQWRAENSRQRTLQRQAEMGQT